MSDLRCALPLCGKEPELRGTVLLTYWRECRHPGIPEYPPLATAMFDSPAEADAEWRRLFMGPETKGENDE